MIPMIFKTTCNKLQLLSVLFLLSITFANAQTSLPYSTDFENGTNGWIDGGGDSQYANNNGFSPQGNDSWEIKDNSGTASSFYQNFDLADYTTVTISFSFQTDSFDDSNDLFEVQLDNATVLVYRYTQDWTRNGRVYIATVTLNSSDYTFTNDSRVRFETAGSTGNNDKLYIDEISITGEKSSAPPTTCSTDSVTLPWTEGFEDTYNNSYTSDNSNIGNCWEYEQTNDGRVDFNQESHTGSKSALFYDDDRNTNDSAENLLTKTINLSNYASSTDLELSFWFADYGDENDGEDAVWIRGNDTADWIKIYDIKPEDFNDSQWNQITGLDIDQTLNDAGQTISETFQIRIGQEDNYQYSNDGIAFDDLQITGTIVEKPTLWKNDITTNDSHNFNPYTANDVFNKDITVSGISRGNGIAGKGRNNTYNADGWDSVSFDTNDYFEFTLTPTVSHEMNFESFVFNSTISNNDNISNIEVRTSLDNYTTSIGSVSANGATIDLTSQDFQAVSTPITFRIYAWGANASNTELGIDNFAFYGSITHYAYWNGTSWENNYLPEDSYKTVIANDYDTETQGSFNCIELIVNEGKKLNIKDNTYVKVQNNTTVNGELVVETKGAFVQINDNATFTGKGKVNKTTSVKKAWYYYTYWSSPVVGLTIGKAFPGVDGDRRFWFDAEKFIDRNNDDIDDNGDDWQYALAAHVMQPGVGYATTEARSHVSGTSGHASFTGAFNTGDIEVKIVNKVENNLSNSISWNLIGNPYPSAIDFDLFYSANSSLVQGVAYLWSQATPPSSSNAGNQNLNFSKDDYAVYSVGVGAGVAGGDANKIPNGFIPTGQSFFIPGLTNGNAKFTNAMRIANETSNGMFFKSTKANKSTSITDNKLWVNLTSNNGVFNQILVAYVDGATNNDDGLLYDAPKIPSDVVATLYSKIEGSNKNFVIQGKDAYSLNENEIINLGFKTAINVATTYTISIAQLQGDFLSNNKVYLEDALLNKTHDLSASDYSFTSAVGEFNNRFKIVFTNKTLSNNDVALNDNSLKIINLENDYVQFKTTNNLSIKSVSIYDLLGRELNTFKGSSNTETYKLSNLKNAVYIAKVTLLNGTIITKKAFKK
jgi:hypothetical protein